MLSNVRLTRAAAIFTVIAIFVSTNVYGQARKRMNVDNISFSGVNAFSENRLRKAMVTRPSHIFKKYRFNQEIFDEDLTSLELLYRQNGYREATIENYSIDADSTQHKISISITMSEGERTFIESVSLLGNTVFSDSILFSEINLKSGDPYRTNRINDATVALLTLYADNGYLDAEVLPEMKINTETHRALVDFNISEKKQYSIGKIEINGLEKTKRPVVSRELIFQSDEIVNYSKLLMSQRNIYLTGLFESVHIHPVQISMTDSTYKDIMVDVKESMSSEFNVSLGYGSEDRTRFKVELFNNNLRGTSIKLGCMARASFIRQGVETSLTNPWTLGKPISTDINMFAEQKFEPGYDLSHYGSKLIFGRKFISNKITAEYRLERSELSDIKTDVIPAALQSDTHSVKLSFIHDSRDNLFNSTRGSYYELSNEVGIFYSDMRAGYYRCTGKWKYFLPLNSLTVVGSSLELGIIKVDGKLEQIPLHERFYAGGSNSLRGFEYKEVGPLDSGRVPTGGKIKLVWNVFELRRTLYKMVGGAVFTDVGMVCEQMRDIRLEYLRAASGIGLRVNTPIGLGRLDYGFNLDRRSQESPGVLHFSMGQIF